MIEIQNLCLTLDKKEILRDINVTLEDGKIHGLVGRNGSGKTMLMKCMCGFVRVTSGQIRIQDKVVGRDIDIPDNMGIILETPGFIPYYNGYKNLKLLANLRRKIKPETIEKYMELVGLDAKSKLAVRKYSLGMRQRLGIAQALMEQPDILILDEPFNGLDKEGVAEMRAVLSSIKGEGRTIILASHNAQDIEILCDKVYEIENGKLAVKKD